MKKGHNSQRAAKNLGKIMANYVTERSYNCPHRHKTYLFLSFFQHQSKAKLSRNCLIVVQAKT